MTYSEAQRRASLKYRQKKRDQINEAERLKYAKMKEEDPEKYKARIERNSELTCLRSKERTAQNRHIRGLMRMQL